MKHICALVTLVVLLTGCAYAPPAHILCLASCSISQRAAEDLPVPPLIPLPQVPPPVSPAPMPSRTIQSDLDGDGQIDRASTHMRPHSMRLDVEIVLAKQANRTIDILAFQQPPIGDLVEAKLRALAPGRYAYACKRISNRDADLCTPGFAQISNRAIEVTAPGLPTLLIWLEGATVNIVRL